MQLKLQLLVWSLIVFSSCVKNEEINEYDTNEPIKKSTFRLEMDHYWQSLDNGFRLNNLYTLEKTKTQIQIHTLKYYISNIRLTNKQGMIWEDQTAAYLVDASSLTHSILTVKNVPVDDYTYLELQLGIDSIYNVSGAQEGALSLDKGMFWTWNTGYIFLKIEGQIEPNSNNKTNFSYHIGGFNEPHKALQTLRFKIDESGMFVREFAVPQIHITVDVARFWNEYSTQSIPNEIHQVSEISAMLMQQFANGIHLDHVHN